MNESHGSKELISITDIGKALKKRLTVKRFSANPYKYDLVKESLIIFNLR